MRKRRTLKGWVEFQSERFRAEDPLIHRFQCLAHSKRYVRLSKHVMFYINARSNFDDRQALRLEAQDATFSDVQHILLKLSCSAAAESNVFDLRDEFAVFALFKNPQSSVFHPQVEAAGGEIAA